MDQNPADLPLLIERRRERSDIPYEAAELYLGSLQRSHSLRAAAVAERNGLLLAGCGATDELELLALWGALEPAERARYSNELEIVCGSDQCVSQQFEIGAETWSVTGIVACSAAANALNGDLRRIFSTQRPSA